MTFLLSLLPFLKRWWKQILSVALLATLTWYVWSAITTYGQERYDAGFAQRDAQYKTELDKLRDDYVKQIENLQKVNNELSTSYQGVLADIRDRPAARTVRVCNNPAPGGVSEAPGTSASGGPHGAPAEGLPQTPGPDIGPFLYGEADTADALAAQLEHLQIWVRQVCQSPDRLRTSF